MCGTLAGLKRAVWAFAVRFDAALVPPAQLAQVLSEAGMLEKVFANIAAECAAHMACAGGGSLREAVSGLARASGTSLSGAAKALEAANQIEAHPEVARAVRLGELSRQQSALVAGAVANNPASAPQLLELARSASMRELADESLRARARSARALKLDARRSTPLGPCATGPAQTTRSTCTAALRQNRVPWSWQRCAPWQTKFSKLPAKKVVGSDQTLMPWSPWSTCDIPGFGVTSVEAVRDMIATGDPVLKAIVTQGK
jgi:hypothetical protein